MRLGRMWNGESRSADRLEAWTGADWYGGQSPGWFECEHACRDPKDGELCLSGAKPEETLVEARSDTDVQIVRLTWSEVGSSGWKSTARRAVSGAPPAALENPEDRVPLMPGRTHNRIRSPSCFRGESGSLRAGRGTDWERPLRGPSPGVEQPTQNCALNVKVKKFNQARVNGGSNYDSLKVAKCLVI
ncbi:hypothetical protein SSX86_030734 [Deinandra increscens subsp. villosa]|uniref:Uncharacterized protein n=1 Tax=Deinandra increscens subsp. villosa TaxID=3103831 RepID=A0AAP0CA97_9ASTR